MPQVPADWVPAPAVAPGAATQEVHNALGIGPRIGIESVRAGLLARCDRRGIAASQPGRSFIDRGIFYRKPIGKRAQESARRRRPSRRGPRAHLRRMEAAQVEFNSKPIWSAR